MNYRMVVGLGNPGKEYDATRHNIGFRVIDAFAETRKASDWSERKKLKGLFAEIIREDSEKLVLVKPTTYMNDSGTAVQKACSYYKIPPEQVIVIYDEINLDTGLVKISLSGSGGGHNGLQSILDLGISKFTRLRVGIGQKPHKDMDLADYVLGKFNESDKATIDASMELYLDSLERLIRDGSEKAMNLINRKPKKNDRDESQL